MKPKDVGDIRGWCLLMVHNERERQERLKREGRFSYTAADPDCPDWMRLAALTEELGEVARAMFKQAHDGPINLAEELTQVAAIALAWLEYLESPRG